METVDRFQSGDRVVIARPGAYPEYEGCLATVVSEQETILTKSGEIVDAYLVDVDGFGIMAAEPGELEPSNN